jgi:F420-non-reducing hydrogenase iron-sulfur subunit
VIPIKVMCSGRVDPTFVLKALRDGADGVIIMGCHPGDCHYNEGNYNAMRRFHLLKRVLAQLGLEDGRVRLEWVSAAEGERFARVVTEMTETVRALGPLNWKEKVLGMNGSAPVALDVPAEMPG